MKAPHVTCECNTFRIRTSIPFFIRFPIGLCAPLHCCCAGAGVSCRLQPGVEKVARVAADPELRDVATSAITILERVSKEGQEAAAQPEAAKAEPAVREQQAADKCSDRAASVVDLEGRQAFIANMCAAKACMGFSFSCKFDLPGT